MNFEPIVTALEEINKSLQALAQQNTQIIALLTEINTKTVAPVSPVAE